MRILVAYATKHGATREIADRIGEVLGAEVHPADQVGDVTGYDAVVLGSAVYLGHWLKSARELADTQRERLRELPVWLFSSGPVGEPPLPQEEPADVAEVAAQLHPREHRLFGGKIDRSALRFPERAVVSALRVKDGDHRDWAEIRAWAEEIAKSLR